MARSDNRDDKNLCKYSENLRNMFSQINPYHISCLYKKTFEEHALDVLRKCDREEDVFSFHSDHVVDDEEFLPWVPDNSECDDSEPECPLEKEKKKQDRVASSLQETQPTFCISGFYEKLSLGPDSKKKHHPVLAHTISPWQTCHTAHLPYLDTSLLPLPCCCADYVHRKSSKRRSGGSSRRPSRIEAWSGETQVTQHHSALCRVEPWERISSGKRAHSNTDERERRLFTSSLADRSMSEEDRRLNVSSTKAGKPFCTDGSGAWELMYLGKSCKGEGPRQTGSGKKDRKVQPIPYKFRSHKNYHQYMEDYRRMYTDVQLHDERHSALDVRENQHVSTAMVECTDVRKGACIRTAASQGNTSPVKLSQYQFPIPSRLKTATSIKSRSKSRSSSRSSSTTPRSTPSPKHRTNLPLTENMTAVELLHVVGYTTNKGKGKKIKGSSSQPKSQEDIKAKGPVICRTRPSIPSNANGVVCASAVETPLHAVPHIRGQQVGSPYIKKSILNELGLAGGQKDRGQSDSGIATSKSCLFHPSATRHCSDPGI